MTDCEATTSLQLADIMKNQIPLPDMTWLVNDINKFIQHPQHPPDEYFEATFDLKRAAQNFLIQMRA